MVRLDFNGKYRYLQNIAVPRVAQLFIHLISMAIYSVGTFSTYASTTVECRSSAERALTNDCIFVSVKVGFSLKDDMDQDGMLDSWEMRHFENTDQNPNDDVDGDGFSNFQEFIRKSDPNVYEIGLQQGWNLISIAAVPTNDAIVEIFDDVSVSQIVWTWVNKQFVPTTRVNDPLQGYWIFLNGSDMSVPIRNSNRDSSANYQITLEKKGWNIISIDRVPKNSTIQSVFFGANVQRNVWTWNNNQMELRDRLEPLRGYWVYANEDGISITINVVE